MDISTVPPVILSAYRGEFVYNTEILKDTRSKHRFMKLFLFLLFRFTEATSILGSQQLLMNLIATKKLNMKDLNTFSLDKLKSIMLSAGFEKCQINQLRHCS